MTESLVCRPICTDKEARKMQSLYDTWKLLQADLYLSARNIRGGDDTVALRMRVWSSDPQPA